MGGKKPSGSELTCNVEVEVEEVISDTRTRRE